jgi:hypothetical protein
VVLAGEINPRQSKTNDKSTAFLLVKTEELLWITIKFIVVTRYYGQLQGFFLTFIHSSLLCGLGGRRSYSSVYPQCRGIVGMMLGQHRLPKPRRRTHAARRTRQDFLPAPALTRPVAVSRGRRGNEDRYSDGEAS